MLEQESNVTIMVATRKLHNYNGCRVSLGFYAPEDHVMLQLAEGYKCQIHVINYLNLLLLFIHETKFKNILRTSSDWFLTKHHADK